MKMNKLFNKLKNIRKRYIVAVVTAVAIAVPAIALAGFGPNRPTFDWNNPADRVGSVNGPVFNSFINTPTYGDERAFVDAKDSANTNTGGFADTVNVQPGSEYTVRAYVHNNANQDLNASGKSVAHNVHVGFNVLPGVANGNEVTGTISADPSNIAPGFPSTVYDTVKLKNDSQAFSLQYVTGSARIENNAHPFPGIALPDSITSAQGAEVGYDQMNGEWPGCFQYTAIVTIKVKVIAPGLQLSKGVSNAVAPSKAETVKNLDVNPGDTITWRLDYKNNGTDVAHNITVRDMIPKGLTLVPNSITWLDANHLNGETEPDTSLGSGGANVGNYAPQGNGVIRYRTTVNSDDREKELCVINNVAFAHAENVPDVSDNASVTIKNCNTPQPPTPSYSCDLLDVVKTGDKSYKFTTSASAAGGASISNYTYDFGDSTTLLTDKSVVTHDYANNGSFVVKVTVHVKVNNKVVDAVSPSCMKPVNVNVTPPVTPPTPPTTLVKTGPGSVTAVFAAFSIAGAMAYRVFVTRRLSE
jgi:uncharacterized repeat protein (TIGR01451 family)